MSKFLTALLTAAQDDNLTIQVGQGDEVDYRGDRPERAQDAIEQLDEANVYFIDDNGDVIGWALIVPDLDGTEVLADYVGGWVDNFYEENA